MSRLPKNVVPPSGMMLVSEAARIATVHEGTIRKWAARGWIRHLRVGGVLWVDETPIRELVGTLGPSRVTDALGVCQGAVYKAVVQGLTPSVRTPSGRFRVTHTAVADLEWMRSDLMFKGEAARLAGVEVRTLTAWVWDGVLRCVTTPGGKQRFVREDVEEAVSAWERGGSVST